MFAELLGALKNLVGLPKILYLTLASISTRIWTLAQKYRIIEICGFISLRGSSINVRDYRQTLALVVKADLPTRQ